MQQKNLSAWMYNESLDCMLFFAQRLDELLCNGAKKKVCNKKTIQKALIEERVVQACSELLTEEKVKYIADQVYAACKKEGDLLSVKRLKSALKETESAIENLWIAMEKGQSVERITERINKREAEVVVNSTYLQNITESEHMENGFSIHM